MKKSIFKNTALATILATTLTACGGGGGGGAGVVIDKARETMDNWSSSVASKGTAGSTPTTTDDSIGSMISTLGKISSSYETSNTDREDAQLVAEFFTIWENFNSELETWKNSTTDREKFDSFMNYTFDANDPDLIEAGLAGKTWRDAHKMIHGAYLLLQPHKELITTFANGGTIYKDSSLYINYSNDSELKKYETYSDAELENKLLDKAYEDPNLVKYNDDAITEKNISELDTIDAFVNSAVTTINSLNVDISATLSEQIAKNGINLSEISSFANYHDVKKSKNIITNVESAIKIFDDIKQDIEKKDADGNYILTTKQRLDFYKSEAFKTAYKSYQYLKNDVKPVINKIKNAGTDQVFLDNSEIYVLANDGKDNYTNDLDIFLAPRIEDLETKYEQENTVVGEPVTTRKIIGTDFSDPIPGTPVIVNTDPIIDIESGSTEEIIETQETTESGAVYKVITTITTPYVTTTKTWNTITTTPYTQNKVTKVELTTITTYGDGRKVSEFSYPEESEVITLDPVEEIEPQTDTVTVKDEPVYGTPVKTLIVNPIVDTVELEPTVSTAVTESEQYTETTSVLGDATSTYTEEGSATTATTYTYSTDTVDNGDGTSTKTTTKYTVTTVTLPVTTYTTKVRTYTDKVYKDVTTTTTSTPRTQQTYADGSTDIVLGTATESQSTVKTFVSESERSVTEIVDSSTADTVTTTTDDGVVHLVEVINANYTDDDPNLGTKTVGYDTDKTTYETDEYLGQTSRSYDHVNISSAYSRGWTGKGSIVAVADTGYDTDHTEFTGQVIATKDYYGNGIQDNHGHGSHVLGTIVAKKDETGTHGVAYDAKAVVIKIGDQRSVSLDHAASGFSWAADQGAIVGNLSANSNYDAWFRNSIEQLSDNTFKTNSTSYDYENGVYYNRMTHDQWKTATDKGMVLVNSAGNQGLDISAMPGWFATETDADGNLVLGGKVLIVGGFNYHSDTDTPIIDRNSNKAGHLCRVVVDNACMDTYKTSDFYVLAPMTTKSTNNNGGYGGMSGTSMAAPVVTGQIAILHQMWPHMKGENLVKLVTATADKSFTGYDVHIHGQGVVDFDESTKPQGAVGIPTTGRVDGAISSISTTSASGSGSIGSAISNVQIMVLDDFDRDYYMNLGNSFTVQDNRKYSDVEMLVDNKNTFLPHQQMYGSFAQGGQYDLAKNYNFGFYTGENGAGDYSLNVGKDFYLNDKFKVKTSVGYMSEQETWLGNTSEGVLAVGDNNDTQSANIGVAYQLGNNVLTLDYSKGKTDINTADGSLIKSFSDVETESYRLAYEIHKDTHTTFGWSFSLPSHITSGTMDLEVAESVNLDGTINYTNINSDLAQGTKEKNIGFFYSKAPAEMFDTGLNFTAEYRTDKSGVANNDGVEMAVKMVKKFAGSCKFLWMKNPKCFDKDGNMKSNLFGTSIDNATKHGLVYDLKTDKFIPIKK